MSWAYVVLKFYEWFIITVFPSLPMLTWSQMIGILTFIGALKLLSKIKIESNKKTKIKKDTIIKNSELILLSPWFLLLYGYIIYIIIY